MRTLLLIALVSLWLPGSALGQAFPWFATTMTSASTSDNAAVRVIPESSWVRADSTVSLSAEAAGLVAAARSAGMKVIAQVGQGLGEPALLQLWAGVVDGLILPPGTFPEPVTRPEETILLSASAADLSLDGALADPGVDAENLLALDSLFAARAPTADDPSPNVTVMRLAATDSPLGVFAPGSVLVPSDVPAEWAQLLAFRAEHPAVAEGIHQRLQVDPYAFYRGLRTGAEEVDQVVIVAGAQGSVRVNVSAVFDDDVAVRDVLSGQIALVSFGQVMMQAGDSGFLLIEALD